MSIQINPNLTKDLNKILVDTFGMTETTASSVTSDNKISGEELWNQYQQLNARIGATCGNNRACLFNSKSQFCQKVDEALWQASGDNGMLDDSSEITVLNDQLHALVDNDFQNKTPDSIENRLEEIQREWPEGTLTDAQIAELLTQNTDRLSGLDDIIVQTASIKREGKPNTTMTLAYFPNTGSVPVSQKTAMEFLINQIDNFPHVTTLYKDIEVYGDHDTQNPNGSFETTNTMMMQDLGFGVLTSTFDTTIAWYKLTDPPGGQETGVSVIYFEFEPNTAKGNIEVTAFTGKFIVRPVVDNQGRTGLLFELHIDFDIQLPLLPAAFKNAIVSWLMKSRIKTFCQEIGYYYLESVRTN